MATTVTLVGFDDQPLEEALRKAGLLVTSVDTAGLSSLAHPSTTPPDVVIVDIRKDAHVPPVLAVLKRQHAAVGLAIVTTALEPGIILEAMRAGVTECVTNPDAAEIQAVVTRLLAQRVMPESGETFAFVGAKGGVGTTTIAVNVAVALGRIAGTLLVDLHLTGGDAALLLGAEARFSVVDALENTHRLDGAFFSGLVTRTSWGVNLLASSERMTVGSLIDGPRVKALIEFASRHYRYVVVDVARSDAASLDALDSANKIVVVADQELATLRAANRLTTMLRQRYGKDRLSVVVGRADRLAEIGLADVERTLGVRVKHMIPSDYRSALDAMNRGKPLVTDASNPLASPYAAFARDLAGVSEKPEIEQRTGGGFLGLLTGRK